MTSDQWGSRVEAVVLADGRDAVIRPLLAEDRESLQQLFDTTSADNLYTRFFGLGASSVTKHLDHLFSNDAGVTTYLVTSGSRVLGVADVELLGEESAEVAFLVADDSHGCGIATLLLERAAGDAQADGIKWFVADVLAINRLMLQVFTDIGFAVTRHQQGCDVSIRMSTELDPAARDAEGVRATSARARRAEARGKNRNDDREAQEQVDEVEQLVDPDLVATRGTERALSSDRSPGGDGDVGMGRAGGPHQYPDLLSERLSDPR